VLDLQEVAAAAAALTARVAELQAWGGKACRQAAAVGVLVAVAAAVAVVRPAAVLAAQQEHSVLEMLAAVLQELLLLLLAWPEPPTHAVTALQPHQSTCRESSTCSPGSQHALKALFQQQ